MIPINLYQNSDCLTNHLFHKAYNSNLSNSHTYVQKQAKAIRELNTQQSILSRQLRSNKITQEKYNTQMDANNAQIQAIISNTEKLTFAQKASAIASKAAGVAMNLALNVGLMFAINLIIAGITKLVNKQKELREATIDSAEQMKEQAASMDELISEYEKILESEKSEVEKVKELNTWKQEISDTYGIEKEKLAGLNLEREDGIKLLQEEIKLTKLRNEAEWQKDNEKAINKAQKKVDNAKRFSALYSKDTISPNIQELFDKNLTNNEWGELSLVALKVDADNAIEELEKLKDIKDKINEISLKRDLSSDEQDLYDKVANQIKRLEKISEDMDIVSQNAKITADIKFENYKSVNEDYENIGKDAYLAWRDGLLKEAEGDTYVEAELLKLAEKQFPDYAKYFKNLEEAKTKFMGTSTPNSGYTAEINSFLESLTDSELERALEIPNLFADGVENAAEKLKTASGAVVEYKDEVKSLSEILEESSKKQSALQSAVDDMAETGRISSSTYSALVELGGNFTEYLEVQNGKLTLNTQKLKELEKQENLNAISANNLAMAELSVSAARAGQIGDTDKVESIRAQINNLEKENTVLRQLNEEINNIQPDEDKNSSSSSSSKPKSVTDFEREYADIQHEIAMGRKEKDEDYYSWLEKRSKEVYTGLAEYQDELYRYEEEVYDGRKKLAEDLFNEQQKLFENQVSDIEARINVTTDKNEDSEGNKLDTKEKFDYIRDGYQEIINITEARINEIVQAGIEGHEDLVAELEKDIESYKEKLADVFKSEVEEEQALIQKRKDSYSDIYDERINKIKEQQKASEEASQAEIDAFSEAMWDPKAVTEDVRLDDGTTNIDNLDAQEYSAEPYMNDILNMG